jgi:hypothetical protein
MEPMCREIDGPTAALIQDLKQRGLLEHTLVIWGGEFGREPMGQGDVGKPEAKVGRNHHIDAYSMFMAGGGIRAGQRIGETDDLGFSLWVAGPQLGTQTVALAIE